MFSHGFIVATISKIEDPRRPFPEHFGALRKGRPQSEWLVEACGPVVNRVGKWVIYIYMYIYIYLYRSHVYLDPPNIQPKNLTIMRSNIIFMGTWRVYRYQRKERLILPAIWGTQVEKWSEQNIRTTSTNLVNLPQLLKPRSFAFPLNCQYKWICVYTYNTIIIHQYAVIHSH